MPAETMTEGVGNPVANRDNDATRTRLAVREQAHALRKLQIMELRRAGLTFEEIGQRLKVSHQSARKAYRSALKDHYRHASEEERETALLRCDGIIKRWWPKLVNTDDDVADVATKNLFRAMDFQADLWGMKRSSVDLNVSGALTMPTDSEVWQALQQFRQAARAAETQVIEVTAIEGPPTNGSHP
jgi:DNA-binding CsgD family transcriptional regulator